MSDIVAERSGNILNIQLNRPAKKNAMTSSMYIEMAELLDGAATDDQIKVAPRPSLAVAHNRPPCDSTMERQ